MTSNRHAGWIASFAPRAACGILGCAAIAALAACAPELPPPASVAEAEPSVTLQLNPSTVVAGEQVTLKWDASNAQSCTASGGWSGAQPTSGTLSLTPTASNSSYTLTCSGTGGSSSQSAEVVVTQPAPTVTLTASPTTVSNLGESTLTWNATAATACTASGGWNGPVLTSGTWSTGALSNTTEFELTCTGPGGSATQSATITVTPSPPAVTITATPSTVSTGSASTLTWTSSNAGSCVASGDWTGGENVNGAQTTGPLTATSTFTLTCAGLGGTAAQSATVSVAAPAPTPVPSVSLTASPSTVTSGGSSTLAWSSTNATSCTASGAWSGSEATSGSHATGALTASATYTLSCSGAGGSAQQSATISVTPPAPSVTLTAKPTTVTSGGTSTLNWSSTHATSCTASGGWSGAVASSGSQSTAALTAATKYTLACSGAGGTASQSVTVSVSAPAPTDGSATLSWIAPKTNTNGTPVTPLTGYTIYYGTSESALTQSVVISGASTKTYEITGLTSGTWYFAIAADASDGTQSPMSNIGSKTI